MSLQYLTVYMLENINSCFHCCYHCYHIPSVTLLVRRQRNGILLQRSPKVLLCETQPNWSELQKQNCWSNKNRMSHQCYQYNKCTEKVKLSSDTAKTKNTINGDIAIIRHVAVFNMMYCHRKLHVYICHFITVPFSALTLLLRWQERYPVCKKIPQSLNVLFWEIYSGLEYSLE